MAPQWNTIWGHGERHQGVKWLSQLQINRARWLLWFLGKCRRQMLGNQQHKKGLQQKYWRPQEQILPLHTSILAVHITELPRYRRSWWPQFYIGTVKATQESQITTDLAGHKWERLWSNIPEEARPVQNVPIVAEAQVTTGKETEKASVNNRTQE